MRARSRSRSRAMDPGAWRRGASEAVRIDCARTGGGCRRRAAVGTGPELSLSLCGSWRSAASHSSVVDGSAGEVGQATGMRRRGAPGRISARWDSSARRRAGVSRGSGGAQRTGVATDDGDDDDGRRRRAAGRADEVCVIGSVKSTSPAGTLQYAAADEKSEELAGPIRRGGAGTAPRSPFPAARWRLETTECGIRRGGRRVHVYHDGET